MAAGFRLLASLLVMQAPYWEPPPTLRITVTLVQVDAVVTDSKGRHVSDLRPEDFEVRQDGQVQKVTYFSYTPEAPPPSLPKLLIGPPAPVTPGQVKRAVALVVDDLALSFESLVRVRDSLRKYVAQQMQPGDLVALVRTAGGVAILEQFTTDKRVLLEGIDLLKWRFSGHQGIIPIHPSGPAEGGPQYLDYGYSLSALGALGTLEQVVKGMQEMPGRKSVVFFSDALRVDQRINSAIDRLTDLSNRSAVSLYTIDPRGLRTYGLTAEDNVDLSAPSAGRILAGIAERQAEQDFQAQEGLTFLATRTGGLFFSNNDIPGSIRRATDDQLGYYLLGYSPREGTFDDNEAKAKFHRVTVRVLRPGLRVRWKSGFTGVPDTLAGTELRQAPKTREQQLVEALASPFRDTGLKVRLTSMYTDTAKTGPIVHSMLHFAAQDLAFTQDPDGSWHATVDVVTSAYRGLKQPIQQRQRAQDISLSNEAYGKALKEGFLYVLNDPMKQPGAFLMRAVVRDAVSQRIGSGSQFVQVPDTRKGQLALSGILLKLAPLDALPKGWVADGLQGSDGKAEAWVEGGPAVRRYRPGQSILYSFIVINAKVSGPAKKSNVISETHLFRNGQLIFTGAPGPLDEANRVDAKRIAGGRILRLGSKLIPGEYLLQVMVTDKLAKKKQSQVAQWIDFEVTAAPR